MLKDIKWKGRTYGECGQFKQEYVSNAVMNVARQKNIIYIDVSSVDKQISIACCLWRGRYEQEIPPAGLCSVITG